MSASPARQPEASGHLYKVGETVTWSGSRLAPRTQHTVEVVRLLPPLGIDLQYRVKSAGKAHENVVSECDLAPLVAVTPTR